MESDLFLSSCTHLFWVEDHVRPDLNRIIKSLHTLKTITQINNVIIPLRFMSYCENTHLEISGRRYFFDKGIYFKCQKCGACCAWEPGAVYLDINESRLIANFLGMKHNTFRQEYLRRLGNRDSLREDPQGRCVFYRNGCVIYTFRPNQCRTYPFWFQNLRAEKNWQRVVQECPGIGKGRKYQKEEILTLLESSFQ